MSTANMEGAGEARDEPAMNEGTGSASGAGALLKAGPAHMGRPTEGGVACDCCCGVGTEAESLLEAFPFPLAAEEAFACID